VTERNTYIHTSMLRSRALSVFGQTRTALLRSRSSYIASSISLCSRSAAASHIQSYRRLFSVSTRRSSRRVLLHSHTRTRTTQYRFSALQKKQHRLHHTPPLLLRKYLFWNSHAQLMIRPSFQGLGFLFTLSFWCCVGSRGEMSHDIG